MSTLNHSFEKDELPTSQKQAIITLIEKKDKNKCFIKNWRPISLISVDIKVASKTLANRPKAVIHNLISVDQTAYVKGRFTIQLNISIGKMRKVSYFQEILKDEDFRFSRSQLFICNFKKIWFWNRICKLYQNTIFDAQNCVINNGYTTDYFNLEHGTRQGDPLSAYLFILVLKVILIQVREDIDIKEFTVNNVELKLSCYADDGYFVVKAVNSIKKSEIL